MNFLPEIKVYHFELDSNEIYEITAVSLADAIGTLEEEYPEITPENIKKISQKINKNSSKKFH